MEGSAIKIPCSFTTLSQQPFSTLCECPSITPLTPHILIHSGVSPRQLCNLQRCNVTATRIDKRQGVVWTQDCTQLQLQGCNYTCSLVCSSSAGLCCLAQHMCVYFVWHVCIFCLAHVCIFCLAHVCIFCLARVYILFGTCVYILFGTCVYILFGTCVYFVWHMCVYFVWHVCIFCLAHVCIFCFCNLGLQGTLLRCVCLCVRACEMKFRIHIQREAL